MVATKTKPKEADIQRDCLATLKSMGIQVWRRNVSAMFGEYKGKSWAVRSGEPGQSDSWGIFPKRYYVRNVAHECDRPGHHFELEFKAPKKRPTLAQILWLRSTNETTGASFWADNESTVVKVMLLLLAGARIVYGDGQESYANPDKHCKGRVMGPSSDYDVELANS